MSLQLFNMKPVKPIIWGYLPWSRSSGEYEARYLPVLAIVVKEIVLIYSPIIYMLWSSWLSLRVCCVQWCNSFGRCCWCSVTLVALGLLLFSWLIVPYWTFPNLFSSRSPIFTFRETFIRSSLSLSLNFLLTLRASNLDWHGTKNWEAWKCSLGHEIFVIWAAWTWHEWYR